MGLMELEVWPSTASSVLMVHSSTRTTSFVTGGSTLTAPLPRISTLSMMKLLLSVKLLQEHLMRVLVPMRHQLTMLLLQHLLAITLLVLMKDLEAMRRKVVEAGGLEAEETTGEEEGVKEGVKEGEETSRVKKNPRIIIGKSFNRTSDCDI